MSNFEMRRRWTDRFKYIYNHLLFKDVPQRKWSELLGIHQSNFHKIKKGFETGEYKIYVKPEALERLTEFVNHRIAPNQIMLSWWNNKHLFSIDVDKGTLPLSMFRTKKVKVSTIQEAMNKLQRMGYTKKEVLQGTKYKVRHFNYLVKQEDGRVPHSIIAHLVDNYNVSLSYLWGLSDNIIKKQRAVFE